MSPASRLRPILLGAGPLLCLAWAAPAFAAVSGTVTTAGGVPIEGARVEVVDSGPAATTGRRGEFAFPDLEPPALLLVTHPRFEDRAVEVPAGAGEPVEVVLLPRQEVFDEITVSATRDAAGVFQPVSVAATSVRPEERPAPPSTLQEMIEGVPGVAETGQGGLFQTYSVRGTAGQRVLSMLAGARLVTDRRAGVAFSFVDPALLGIVDVVRGPSSSYYGSGALGGVIQAFPRRFDQLRLAGGYASAGGEHYQTAGWGSGAWSMGVARRVAADARTPEGERLFSRFEQWSGVVEGLWEAGEATSLELVVIPSVGRDIGKPNREFPERTTLYPEEQHLVASFTARKPGSYRLNAWAHPNTLETRVSDEAGVDRVENEAADFGANAQWELDLGGRLSGRIGLDFFGRRGVRATEERFAAGGDLVERATTLDGEEDEAALYGALRRAVGGTTVEAGARFTYLRQGNAGFASQDDTAWSGFVGASRPLVGGFDLAANLGTGLRFPSLSERFFTGTTGRGDVVSNLDLEPERSVSADAGVRYYGNRLFAAAYAFRNEIDDYIERLQIEPGVRTFVNLTSGTITGIETNGFVQASDRLRLSWDGLWIEGEDARGGPLADIPPDRVAAQADWRQGRWELRGRLQHRLAKDDPGSGEQPVSAADLLSAALSYELRDGFRLSLSGDNLLDETYLPSADEQSVPAQERSLGLGIVWSD
ncbi:MAG TPA: TonB-dependent receptor [Thermoanaerobaculia bacterium]|nr:TonB-dependent receptor [Thermoanaerobaculia bacterium]